MTERKEMGFISLLLGQSLQNLLRTFIVSVTSFTDQLVIAYAEILRTEVEIAVP